MRHTNPTPCKGKSLIIKLLPLQGALFNIYTQHPGRCPGLCGCWAFLLWQAAKPSAARIDWVLTHPPLENAVCFVGAAETAAPPDVCSKSVIRVSSACSGEADFCTLKISQKKLWNPPPNPMQILYKWVQRKSSFWRNGRRVFRFKKAKVGRKTIKSEGF